MSQLDFQIGLLENLDETQNFKNMLVLPKKVLIAKMVKIPR